MVEVLQVVPPSVERLKRTSALPRRESPHTTYTLPVVPSTAIDGNELTRQLEFLMAQRPSTLKWSQISMMSSTFTGWAKLLPPSTDFATIACPLKPVPLPFSNTTYTSPLGPTAGTEPWSKFRSGELTAWGPLQFAPPSSE